MAETKFVRVTHGGEAHFVALYTGLNPQEVSRLLQAAFRLPQHVIGLMDREADPGCGVVVPMSLACRAPEMLGDRSYSLLLSEKEVAWEGGQTPRVGSAWGQGAPLAGGGRGTVSARGGGGGGGGGSVSMAFLSADTNYSGNDNTGGGRSASRAGSVVGAEEEEEEEEEGEEEEEEEEDDEEEEEEEEDDDIVNVDTAVKIVAFIRRMTANGMLTGEDRDALESSAVAGDAVINAAFAVAVHSQDLDYLAALFTDIATVKRGNLQDLQLLEAKREMLVMAEVLHQAGEVDDEQLVYLQKLVLVSNEAVTAAFRVYEEDQDLVRLAESLKQLCGAGANSKQPTRITVGSTGGGREKAIPVPVNAPSSGTPTGDLFEAERDAMKVTILKEAVKLANKGLLGALEARVLKKMVSQESPVLMAAFRIYQEDGNLADLQDTVARAARIQAKRLLGVLPTRTDPPRAELASDTPPVPPQGHSMAQGPEHSMAQAEGQGRLVLPPAPTRSSARSTPGDGGAGGARGGRSLPAKSAAHGSGVGVAPYRDGGGGAGGGVAPTEMGEFLRLVTVAVRNGAIDMEHARVLCSAFESGSSGEEGRLQELVVASWGVYSTGGSEEDAVDSLARIAQLAVKPYQPIKPAATNQHQNQSHNQNGSQSSSTVSVRSTGQKAASPATDGASSGPELRERMSAAVTAIASQSANILLHSGKVSPEEASCLASPSPAGCQAIFRALEAFERDSNRDRLLTAFSVIAKRESAQRQGSEASSPQRWPSPRVVPRLVQEEEEEEGEEEEDEDDEEEDDDEDEGGGKEEEDGSGVKRGDAMLADGEGEEDGKDGEEESGEGGREARSLGDEGGQQSFTKERARMELMELADCMAGDKRIGPAEALHLSGLIENEHPGVMHAYRDYVHSQDVSVLVGALIGIVGGGDGSASPSEAAGGAGAGEGGGGEGEEGQRGADAQQMGRERVVLLMHETRVLSASDATRLLLLLSREDPTALAAFSVFESSKDVSELVETVKIILEGAPAITQSDLELSTHQGDRRQHSSSSLLSQILQPIASTGNTPRITEVTEVTEITEQPAAAPKAEPTTAAAATATALEAGSGFRSGLGIEGMTGSRTRGGGDDADAAAAAADDDGGGDGGDDDGDGDENSDDDDSVAATVVGIVDSMGLDESESAALRLAIACGDANVKGAVELFKMDSDAKELKDTLGRVARHVLEREAGLPNEPSPTSGALSGGVSSGGYTEAEGGVGGGGGGDGNPDLHVSVEGRMRKGVDLAQDGKEGLFQELLQQLATMSVVSEAQAAAIMERYLNKDAVVLAALDVYKNENDMSELVDTLKRVT